MLKVGFSLNDANTETNGGLQNETREASMPVTASPAYYREYGPRPNEPDLTESWGPLAVTSWVKLTRSTVSILTFIWLIIIAVSFGVFLWEEESCEPCRANDTFTADNIPFRTGRNLQDREFLYKLKRYKLYDNSVLKNENPKKDEIIVVYIPGDHGLAMAQQHLATLVRDRTVDEQFRFIWYVLDTEEYLPVNGFHFANQFSYMMRSMEFLAKKHPKKRFLVIGNSYGGAVAHSLVSLNSVKHLRELTNMIVFESSQIITPTILIDHYVNTYYTHVNKEWQNSIDRRIGLVAYSGGLRSTDAHVDGTRVRRAVHVPSWSISGVPDAGLWDREMLVCSSFISHVADLFVEYGKHFHNVTGREIVRKFYADYDWQKAEKLPLGWNNDWVPNGIAVQTGGRYAFTMDKQQWLEVKLERDEPITITIIGSCLNTATIARQKKHIRRKDKFTNETQFVFGVYNVKLYEDVRLLLESDSPCDVVIETSSPLWKYGYRFVIAVVQDTHYVFLGMLLTATYFLLIEGDKRSVRCKRQFEFHVFLILATLYHSFHPYGLSNPGLVLGAAMFTILFAIASAFEQYFLKNWRITLDSYISYDQVSMNVLAGASTFLTLVAHNYGFLLMYLSFLFMHRLHLVMCCFASLIPMLMRTFMSTYIFTLNYLLGPQAYSIVTILINFGLVYHEVKFTRKTAYKLTCIVLILQICFAHYAMDIHYAVELFVFVLITHTPNHTPSELYSREVDLKVLQEQENEAEEDSN